MKRSSPDWLERMFDQQNERHAINLSVQHLKGAERIAAAHQLYPWLAAPDYSEPFLIEGAGIMGDRIADTPSFGGVYIVTATVQGHPLTLYAGESGFIWERIGAHFPNPGEWNRSPPLRPRLAQIEDATGALCESVTVAAWQIDGDDERKQREREALDAFGAAFEYRDRRAADCLPATITEAMRRRERLAIKRGASAQLAKAQGRA